MKYSLIKVTYNGNSCVLKENLIEYVVALLDVMTENVEDALINLKAKDEIAIEERDDGTGTWIYLRYFYNTEQEIAIRIKRLQESANIKKIKNIKAALKKVEMNSNIELSEKQKESIELVDQEQEKQQL